MEKPSARIPLHLGASSPYSSHFPVRLSRGDLRTGSSELRQHRFCNSFR
jgi:hypothetical protein